MRSRLKTWIALNRITFHRHLRSRLRRRVKGLTNCRLVSHLSANLSWEHSLKTSQSQVLKIKYPSMMSKSYHINSKMMQIMTFKINTIIGSFSTLAASLVSSPINHQCASVQWSSSNTNSRLSAALGPVSVATEAITPASRETWTDRSFTASKWNK